MPGYQTLVLICDLCEEMTSSVESICPHDEEVGPLPYKWKFMEQYGELFLVCEECQKKAEAESKSKVTSDPERFFVDDRCGCVAVRDRTLLDENSPGLHGDEPDCVKFWMKGKKSVRCQCCDHIADVYVLDDHVDDAHQLAKRLNQHNELSPEVVRQLVFNLQDRNKG